MSKEYKLRIEYDLDPSDPFGDDDLVTFHSFSTRHVNFTDPDVLLACQYEFPEGHEDDGFTCDAMPTAHAEGRIEDHEWDGPEGFLLSYFEHGLCRWGVQGSMTGMPDFRWDGVEVAGFLELNLSDENRTWWDEKSDDEKREMAASMCEVYTDYCNGEVYGYTLTRNGEAEDSCWGFYGDDIIGMARELVATYGLTPENTKIKGEAEGALWQDIFEPAKV